MFQENYPKDMDNNSVNQQLVKNILSYKQVAGKSYKKKLFRDLILCEDIIYEIASFLGIYEGYSLTHEAYNFYWLIGRYNLGSLNRNNIATNNTFIAPFLFSFDSTKWVQNILIHPLIYIVNLTQNRLKYLPNKYISSNKPTIIGVQPNYGEYKETWNEIKRKTKKVFHPHVSLQKKQKQKLSKENLDKKFKRYKSRTFARVTKNIKLFSTDSYFSMNEDLQYYYSNYNYSDFIKQDIQTYDEEDSNLDSVHSVECRCWHCCWGYPSIRDQELEQEQNDYYDKIVFSKYLI